MRTLSLIFFLTLGLATFGQNNGLIGQKKNQTDEKGLKQGYWQKNYRNGKPKYTVTFKDDKPIGDLKRFYPNGKLKAHLVYNEKGYATAKMYDEKGKLVSEGFYIGKQKDSLWVYYSVDDKKLMQERFKNGKATGKSEKFFKSGKLAEVTMYKNGAKDGLWRQFYENGRTKMESRYVEGQRDGVFNHFYETGRYKTKGAYKNDQKDGKWISYNPQGEVIDSVTYIEGKPSKEWLEKEHENLKKMEKEGKQVLDPQQFLHDPSEYIRQSRRRGGQ